LIDTIYHGIFSSAAAAGTVVGLNIMVGLVQLLFFIVLYQQFVPEDKPALRTSFWLASIGSCIGLLPKLLAMAVLFQPQSLFFFLRHRAQITAFCPWMSAVFLLAFNEGLLTTSVNPASIFMLKMANYQL
jgi:hypothetical protein